MAPKNARKRRTSGRPQVEAPAEVRGYFERGEEPLDVDVEKHLKWLETGKGEPWPPARRARRARRA